MAGNKPRVQVLGAIFTFIFSFFSGAANSDEISFYRNVVEKFSHKDWVAYKTDSGHCRPTTEFLIGGTVASLAILRTNSSNQDSHAWAHVYGKYTESIVELNVDGKSIRWRSLEQEIIEKIANARNLTVKVKLYDELPPQGMTQDIVDISTTEHRSEVSLAGSSAALRFCNFID